MNSRKLINSAKKINVAEAQRAMRIIERTPNLELRKKQIRRAVQALPQVGNVVSVGQILFRASLLADDERPESVGRLSYPPEDKIKSFGRCNLPENPVLYTAAHEGAALLEVQPKVGTKCVISQWQATRVIVAIPLGYSADELVIQPEGMEYRRELYASYGKGFDQIHSRFNQWFGHLGEVFYEITATLTNILFEDPVHVDEKNPGYSGRMAVQYRSRRFAEVSGGQRADNVTICKASVDAGDVVPIAAHHCEVTKADGGRIDVKILSRTTSIEGDRLVWE
ncbi:hypothetical protein [Falsiruegeria mediterranea]|nr:hypothetical protein [Falsiruegeria mediterranea]